MTPLTSEWVEKAEGDFATARRELAVTVHANPDAICFHCQQCAEKYLKAALQESGVVFPRTHDLLTVLNLALPAQPTWTTLQRACERLTDYAVQFRYPGESADVPEAQAAMTDCEQIRLAVRQHFGLPV